jgi:hypothetical protein
MPWLTQASDAAMTPHAHSAARVGIEMSRSDMARRRRDARPVPTAAQTQEVAPQGPQLVRLPHRAFSRAPDGGQAAHKPLEHVSCWRRCERPAEKGVNGYPRPKDPTIRAAKAASIPPLHPGCKTGPGLSPTSVGAAQNGDFPPGSSPPNRQVRMQKAGGRKPASSIPRVAHRCAHLPPGRRRLAAAPPITFSVLRVSPG